MKTITKEIKKEVTLKLPETLDECEEIECVECVYVNERTPNCSSITNCVHRKMLKMYFSSNSKFRVGEESTTGCELSTEFAKQLMDMVPIEFNTFEILHADFETECDIGVNCLLSRRTTLTIRLRHFD